MATPWPHILARRLSPALPRTTTVFKFRRLAPGVPYASRPDLGIDPDDVKVQGRRMTVTVHSVGAVDAPAAQVVVCDTAGKVLARGAVPALKAPVDLRPKVASVTLRLPANAVWTSGTVTIEVPGRVPEITLQNNTVALGGGGDTP